MTTKKFVDGQSREFQWLFGSFFHRGFDDRRECPLRVVSGHVRTAAYGPEAEVREVHTFDATPILRMTAIA